MTHLPFVVALSVACPPPQKPAETKTPAPLAVADEPKKEEPKGKEVKSDCTPGHFEKNSSGLKGDMSFLVITDARYFGDVFGIARTMGPKPQFRHRGPLDKEVVCHNPARNNSSPTKSTK